MPSLPEELFREKDEPTGSSSTERTGSTALPSRRRGTVGVGITLAALAGAIVVGFAGGRFAGAGQVPLVPVPTTAPVTTARATEHATLSPYEGNVTTLPALDATGAECSDAATDTAENLVDRNPMTIWRCTGTGLGEQIRFWLPGGRDVVGVRVVNGNTRAQGRYTAERRVLTLRWTFGDGSWLEQNLSGNDRSPQEIRFPAVPVDGGVTLTIVQVSVPGGSEERDDAVSISAVEFLTPA